MQGLHGLYLLQTGNDSNIYKEINKFLSEGYAVIYALEERGKNELVSKNQRINRIYSKMTESQLIENLEDYVETGALTIVDPKEMYRSSGQKDTVLLKRWIGLVEELRKKGNFKNIIIMHGGVTVLDDDRLDRLVSYEHAISNAVEKLRSVSVICCYLEESIDTFRFDQMVSIIHAHQATVGLIDDSLEYRKTDSAILFDAIIEGIEDVLGKGNAKLVLQTMKSVYNVNEDMIISNPLLFQSRIEKFLGKSSIKVLDSVNRRIKETLLVAGVLSLVIADGLFSSILV